MSFAGADSNSEWNDSEFNDAEYDATETAEYLLSLEPELVVEGATKLQTLLYYAQGIYLQMYGCALFVDPIQACEKGPAIPIIEKKIENQELKPKGKNESVLPFAVQMFLDDIFDQFYKDALQLSDKTHEAKSWCQAYQKGKNTRLLRSDIEEDFESVAYDFTQGRMLIHDKEILFAPCPIHWNESEVSNVPTTESFWY